MSRTRDTAGIAQDLREAVTEASSLDEAVSFVGRGAIVESGTNANGSFVRWENGEQVCFSEVTQNRSIQNSYLGGFRDSANTATELPADFSSTSYSINCLGSIGEPSFSWAESTGNRTQGSFRVVPTAVSSQSAEDRNFSYFAWGFWK